MVLKMMRCEMWRVENSAVLIEEEDAQHVRVEEADVEVVECANDIWHFVRNVGIFSHLGCLPCPRRTLWTQELLCDRIF